MEMVPNTEKLGADQPLPSSKANVTSAVPIVTPRTSPQVIPQVQENPFGNEEFILDQIKKMSSDIKNWKSLMTELTRAAQQAPGSDRYRRDDVSYLPTSSSWDLFGSVSSFDSSINFSFFSEKHSAKPETRLSSRRKYHRDLLISYNIYLAFQHGTCPHDDKYQGYHPNAHGQKVLQYCGLCETDSPNNQCYYPANKCPGLNSAVI